MSTIIGNLNTQRNTNCVVQASQLNGGNLSQFFNLQSMRMVKGTVVLPTAVSQRSDGNVLINEYDGSAIELGGADVIVAAVVENGSGSDQGSVGYLPLSATGGVPGVIFTYGALPSFNPAQNSWIAGQTGESISNVLTLTQLNTGISFTPIVSTTSAQMKYWINCVGNGGTAFTSLNPVLNVTLLVLNPSLAM